MATAIERLGRATVTVGNALHDLGFRSDSPDLAVELELVTKEITAQIDFKVEKVREQAAQHEAAKSFPVTQNMVKTLAIHTGKPRYSFWEDKWTRADFVEFMNTLDHSGCNVKCPAKGGPLE